jgi:hypothetical protein
MVYNVSGFKYNRRAEVAFAALSNTVRVVDDFLRFDRTFSAQVRGESAVQHAAQTTRIAFSKDKFRLTQSRTSNMVYNFRHGDITIEEKIKALS